MRSENPLSFPVKIYPHPSELDSKYPTKLYDSETPVEPIKDLNTVPCVMQENNEKFMKK